MPETEEQIAERISSRILRTRDMTPLLQYIQPLEREENQHYTVEEQKAILDKISEETGHIPGTDSPSRLLNRAVDATWQKWRTLDWYHDGYANGQQPVKERENGITEEPARAWRYSVWSVKHPQQAMRNLQEQMRNLPQEIRKSFLDLLNGNTVTMDYGDPEAFTVRERNLIRDVATTYLAKELELGNYPYYGNDVWEPTSIRTSFRPERLREYLELGHLTAELVKNDLIGPELIHPGVGFTNPWTSEEDAQIRDVEEQDHEIQNRRDREPTDSFVGRMMAEADRQLMSLRETIEGGVGIADSELVFNGLDTGYYVNKDIIERGDFNGDVLGLDATGTQKLPEADSMYLDTEAILAEYQNERHKIMSEREAGQTGPDANETPKQTLLRVMRNKQELSPGYEYGKKIAMVNRAVARVLDRVPDNSEALGVLTASVMARLVQEDLRARIADDPLYDLGKEYTRRYENGIVKYVNRVVGMRDRTNGRSGIEIRELDAQDRAQQMQKDREAPDKYVKRMSAITDKLLLDVRESMTIHWPPKGDEEEGMDDERPYYEKLLGVEETSRERIPGRNSIYADAQTILRTYQLQRNEIANVIENGGHAGIINETPKKTMRRILTGFYESDTWPVIRAMEHAIDRVPDDPEALGELTAAITAQMIREKFDIRSVIREDYEDEAWRRPLSPQETEQMYQHYLSHENNIIERVNRDTLVKKYPEINGYLENMMNQTAEELGARNFRQIGDDKIRSFICDVLRDWKIEQNEHPGQPLKEQLMQAIRSNLETTTNDPHTGLNGTPYFGHDYRLKNSSYTANPRDAEIYKSIETVVSEMLNEVPADRIDKMFAVVTASVGGIAENPDYSRVEPLVRFVLQENGVLPETAERKEELKEYDRLNPEEKKVVEWTKKNYGLRMINRGMIPDLKTDRGLLSLLSAYQTFTDETMPAGREIPALSPKKRMERFIEEWTAKTGTAKEDKILTAVGEELRKTGSEPGSAGYGEEMESMKKVVSLEKAVKELIPRTPDHMLLPMLASVYLNQKIAIEAGRKELSKGTLVDQIKASGGHYQEWSDKFRKKLADKGKELEDWDDKVFRERVVYGGERRVKDLMESVGTTYAETLKQPWVSKDTRRALLGISSEYDWDLIRWTYFREEYTTETKDPSIAIDNPKRVMLRYLDHWAKGEYDYFNRSGRKENDWESRKLDKTFSREEIAEYLHAERAVRRIIHKVPESQMSRMLLTVRLNLDLARDRVQAMAKGTGRSPSPEDEWNEYVKQEPRIVKELIKGDRTMEKEEMLNKEQAQEVTRENTPEKKRMQYSRRPQLYKQTSQMIKELAAEVLREKSIEPIVDRFQRTENPVSHTKFRAVNTLALTSKAREMGYNDDRWITFNQAKAYSLHLKKGEKGVIVTHYGIATQKEIDALQRRADKWNERHPEEKKTVKLQPGQRFAKDYFVYNARQFSEFPPKTPEYTKEEQAKILTKIHEVAGRGAPLPEHTSPREVLQEGVAAVMYSEDSPVLNSKLDMAEMKVVAELASGMLHKELDMESNLRPETYEGYIARDDELDHTAFDKIRENPNRIVAYLNMAEQVIDQVRERVIGRELLHPEIAFSDRMETVQRSTKEERIEYVKGREAGLSQGEIEKYMKPEIQEKWPQYREKFAEVKNSVEKSMDRIRSSIQIKDGPEKNTVTVEAPRTLLEKIRTAENKTLHRNPKDYLKDFHIKQNTFTFTMPASQKDPIFAACGNKQEVMYGVENTFRDRRVRDLEKAVTRDVDRTRNPEKAQTKEKGKGLELTR